MPLSTEGTVEEIKGVVDADGNKVAPATQAAQGDFDSLEGDSYALQAADTEEPLPSHDIPVGSTLMVVFDAGNASTVSVGPQGHVAFPLQAVGDHFTADVNDSAEVYIKGSNTGDSVTLIWEA